MAAAATVCVPRAEVQPDRQVTVSCASLSSWGSVWNGQAIGAKWSSRDRNKHINLLELKAVHLATVQFHREHHFKHILLR